MWCLRPSAPPVRNLRAQVVNDTLANNYIRADEAMKAQSKVKEKGRWTFR
jgi:predicted ATP-dependent Lon-type protease